MLIANEKEIQKAINTAFTTGMLAASTRIINEVDELGAAELMPDIKSVMFNEPATIIFWDDNTKTVVKAVGEPFDKEKGFAMAYIKKMFGNSGRYFDMFTKFCDD